MQWDLQVRTAGYTLRHRIHVILNRFVLHLWWKQMRSLHFFDGLLATFDVVLLARLDLTEPDVLYVAPSALRKGAIGDLLLYLPVDPRPFFDQVQLRVQIVVSGRNSLRRQNLGFTVE